MTPVAYSCASSCVLKVRLWRCGYSWKLERGGLNTFKIHIFSKHHLLHCYFQCYQWPLGPTRRRKPCMAVLQFRFTVSMTSDPTSFTGFMRLWVYAVSKLCDHHISPFQDVFRLMSCPFCCYTYVTNECCQIICNESRLFQLLALCALKKIQLVWWISGWNTLIALN